MLVLNFANDPMAPCSFAGTSCIKQDAVVIVWKRQALNTLKLDNLEIFDETFKRKHYK